jgi:hypothetical protein
MLFLLFLFHRFSTASTKMDLTCPIIHCKLLSETLDCHLQHLHTHEGQTLSKFQCCSPDCLSTFTYVRSLKKHLTLFHPEAEDRPAPKRQKLFVADSRQFDFQFKCPHLSCGHVCLESLKEIKAHLCFHAHQGEEVLCPFKACDKKYAKRTSFLSHMDRFHCGQSVSNLKQCSHAHDIEIADCDTASSSDIEESQTRESLSPTSADASPDIVPEAPNSSLLYNLGDFYNQLLHSNRVPYSTVQMIINKYLAVYRQGQSSKGDQIRSLLTKEGVSDDLIDRLLQDIQEKDEFLLAHDTSLEHNLGSQYYRTKFIEDSFPFVSPRTCILNPEERKDMQRSFQYMSILETFILFNANSGYLRQIKVQQNTPSHDMIQSITDGEFYKTNPFFVDNPDAVPILMYSDAACLINPLNTGKTKTHKMTGFYFTFGNLPVWNRSKVDPLQVAIYVLEVDLLKFGYDAVLKPLIDDLKKLEQGVVIAGRNAPVKAGLALWIADNLGAHEVAGLSKSFSSGHICRTCIITYAELKEGRVHPRSSAEGGAYEALDKIKYDSALLSGDGQYGVQKACSLNELASFHCAGQCPPCYAHDILEGVASYDLFAYLKVMLTEKKLFTLERLNQVVKEFPFTKYNRKDVPPPIVLKNKAKLSMSAGQMRVLLRYIGMILECLNCDSSDPVCRQIILLSEIFAYTASPRLHRLEVEEMESDIYKYLDRAQDLLGKSFLKPKHHFVAHYGDNYRQYGPLNNVSSLRYESKHRFAKDTVHKAKNFKNVVSLLAVRHQRLQSHLFHTGLFPNDLDVHGDVIHLFDAISDCDPDDEFNHKVLHFIKDLDDSASVCQSITYRSTLYEPGLLVAISQDRFSDLMTVGRILKCFVSHTEPAFVVRRYDAVKTSKGFYKSYNKSHIMGIRCSDLLDYMPLIPITSSTGIKYALHHYISSFT